MFGYVDMERISFVLWTDAEELFPVLRHYHTFKAVQQRFTGL